MNSLMVTAPEKVILPIQDERVALAVILGCCMLSCAIWGAAYVIATAIKEKR